MIKNKQTNKKLKETETNGKRSNVKVSKKDKYVQLLEAMYIFNAIPIKMSMESFREIKKNSKICVKEKKKKTMISQTNLEREQISRHHTS